MTTTKATTVKELNKRIDDLEIRLTENIAVLYDHKTNIKSITKTSNALKDSIGVHTPWKSTGLCGRVRTLEKQRNAVLMTLSVAAATAIVAWLIALHI